MDVEFLLDIADQEKSVIEKALLRKAIKAIEKDIKYYEVLIRDEPTDEFNGVNTSRRSAIAKMKALIEKLS